MFSDFGPRPSTHGHREAAFTRLCSVCHSVVGCFRPYLPKQFSGALKHLPTCGRSRALNPDTTSHVLITPAIGRVLSIAYFSYDDSPRPAYQGSDHCSTDPAFLTHNLKCVLLKTLLPLLKLMFASIFTIERSLSPQHCQITDVRRSLAESFGSITPST